MGMTTATQPIVEIVPTGASVVQEPGRRQGNGFTTKYDVVCSRCGPVESEVMYPTACAERSNHLCRPRARRG